MSNTNLEQVQGALVAFDRVSAGLSELAERYSGVVYDVRTGEGMEAAREARRVLREPRYEVERIRQAAKKPLLELGRQLDTEAKRITGEILKIEEPITAQIQREEERREAERAAKIKAERERVEGIRARIDAIRNFAIALASHSAQSIAEHIDAVGRLMIDDSFGEFQEEATRVRHYVHEKLTQLHAAAVQREEEAARIAAERVELERLRAAQALQEAAEREQRAAEAKAERERLAAERRQLEVEREMAARQRAAEAAEAERLAERLRAEREAFEAERAAAKAAAEAAVTAARQPEPEVVLPVVVDRPEASTVIALVADTFIVDHATAEGWLRELFGTKAKRRAA